VKDVSVLRNQDQFQKSLFLTHLQEYSAIDDCDAVENVSIGIKYNLYLDAALWGCDFHLIPIQYI